MNWASEIASTFDSWSLKFPDEIFCRTNCRFLHSLQFNFLFSGNLFLSSQFDSIAVVINIIVKMCAPIAV